MHITTVLFHAANDHSIQVLHSMRPPAPEQGDLARETICVYCSAPLARRRSLRLKRSCRNIFPSLWGGREGLYVSCAYDAVLGGWPDVDGLIASCAPIHSSSSDEALASQPLCQICVHLNGSRFYYSIISRSQRQFNASIGLDEASSSGWWPYRNVLVFLRATLATLPGASLSRPQVLCSTVCTS